MPGHGPELLFDRANSLVAKMGRALVEQSARRSLDRRTRSEVTPAPPFGLEALLHDRLSARRSS